MGLVIQPGRLIPPGCLDVRTLSVLESCLPSRKVLQLFGKISCFNSEFLEEGTTEKRLPLP